MPEKPVFLTEEGHKHLQSELEHLRSVRRPEVAQRIQRAKELESTVNNAEYDDAKNEQAFVEGRILDLETMLTDATVVQHKESTTVVIGSKVTLVNQDGQEENYTIVGSAEVNLVEGKISNESPVGTALLGRRVEEEIEVSVPSGIERLKIVAIC